MKLLQGGFALLIALALIGLAEPAWAGTCEDCNQLTDKCVKEGDLQLECYEDVDPQGASYCHDYGGLCMGLAPGADGVGSATAIEAGMPVVAVAEGVAATLDCRGRLGGLVVSVEAGQSLRSQSSEMSI